MANDMEKVLRAAMDARVCAMLVGPPGTAKTATIKSVAEEMGYDLITIVPSRMDAQDISGFPTKGEYTYEDVKSSMTEYAPQHWQLEIMEKKKVILFLDEFSNAHPSTRASLLSFIQDRQFPNGDFFPEETILVGAMNPTDSAADGYELDKATTNRMMFISWKPDTASWLEKMPTAWGNDENMSANERKWRHLIVRFIKDNPGMLHKENDELGNPEIEGISPTDSSSLTVHQYAWASRRSWDNVAKVLGALTTKETSVEDTIIAGMVGSSAAHHFRDWIRKNGAVNISKILSDPRSFEDWETLSADDSNMILRSAIDGVSEENIYNVIDIFRILTEIDRQSFAAPYLQEFSALSHKLKLSQKEKMKVQQEQRDLIGKFRDIGAASRRTTTASK